MPVRCPALLLAHGGSTVLATVRPLVPGLSHGGGQDGVPQLPLCGSCHFPLGQD